MNIVKLMNTLISVSMKGNTNFLYLRIQTIYC
jgi:hypothetical protein